jgi:CheY-like chemotaxis protein
MPNTSPRKCAILIVDSDPLTRGVLHETLQRAGHEVMSAADVGAAVDRLKMSDPDLLIVRPYISSMSGAMAAKYLRTRCPGLPVLIVGGYIEDDRVRVPSEVHDFHVFPKPFGSDELLKKVTEVLHAVHGKGR